MSFSVLVTGASRGIGRAIALELAESGCRVALVARRAEPLDRVAAEVEALGGRAWTFPCDLTDTRALSALVDGAAGALGGLDALVNNAGAFDFTPAPEADLARWDALLDLNLRAVLHLTRHALPHLQARERSAVINIASMAGKDPVVGGGAYCATKFGLFGFGGALFQDVRSRGVKVCTIGPGQASRVDHAPPLDAGLVPGRDVARVVRFVLEFPATSCPTEILLRAQHPAPSQP